jgi:hypothetical protein
MPFVTPPIKYKPLSGRVLRAKLADSTANISVNFSTTF